jgi:alkanesulfonate monooxygenase SsuD/methylene tetrahydromethanopterin reductase-like flavin-dependent oxidoreductase (luciferase family)
MDYGQPVRFGVFVIPHVLAGKRPLEIAQIADELDFDLVGVQDHPYQRSFYDAWTLLTAMAMRTERITVFPDVANLQLRPPAILAKSAASLDRLSDGRVELGLGAGGFSEAVVAFGGPKRTPAESVSALEEAIQVIRLVWASDRNARFEGKFYSLKGANTGPPAAHPIGIWLGAYRPRMLEITGRLADGWVPSYGYVKADDLGVASARIDAAARAAGRDPKAIRRILNIGPPPEEDAVELMTNLAIAQGIDTFIVGEGDEDPRAHLSAFMRDVAPRVREAVAEARARG